MTRIRAIIVDDVEAARERVRIYLKGESDIDIVGEAANGADALRLIANQTPDLAFLDVQLPDFDGFEVVQRLAGDARPIVIFLTAHDDKAIKAFDVAALDYLLKPFDRDRFHHALNRARTQLALRGRQSLGITAYPQRLPIKDGDRTAVVATRDIDYVDVAGHYLCIHVGKEVHLMRGALTELETRLDPAEFARIHRSVIVRLDRIKALVARRNGDGDIVLHDGRKLLLSRSYRDAIRCYLGLPED